MVNKLIITKDGSLRSYDIKNLKSFNEKYIPLSKVGNRLIYGIAKPTKRTSVVLRKKRKEKEVITIKTKPIKGLRIRKQLVQNFTSDNPPYYVSIRAITINPNITEKGLRMALLQGRRKFQNTENVNLNLMNTEYYGLEQTPIPDSEDIKLNDGRIHIEVFVANKGRENKPLIRYYIL